MGGAGAAGAGSAASGAGDGVLARIKYHTQGDGLHMDEQLDKNTGYETAAKDLTWSYAAVLKAVSVRSAAVSFTASGPAVSPSTGNVAPALIAGTALAAVALLVAAVLLLRA